MGAIARRRPRRRATADHRYAYGPAPAYYEGYYGWAPGGYRGYYSHGHWFAHRRWGNGVWIYF